LFSDGSGEFHGNIAHGSASTVVATGTTRTAGTAGATSTRCHISIIQYTSIKSCGTALQNKWQKKKVREKVRASWYRGIMVVCVLMATVPFGT